MEDLPKESGLDNIEDPAALELAVDLARTRRVQELVGNPNQPGSNEWKIENLKEEAPKHPGVPIQNDLKTEVVLYSEDDKVLSEESREHAMEINRLLLERLLELHHGKFGDALVDDKEDQKGYIERTILYPTTEGFSFVETYIFANLFEANSGKPPGFYNLRIVASEKG